GFITAVQCEQVGIASLLLGGGRSKKEDVIDHAVGIEVHKKIGDAVAIDESICTVHYNADTRLPEAYDLLRRAYTIGAERTEPPRLVRRDTQRAAAASGPI